MVQMRRTIFDPKRPGSFTQKKRDLTGGRRFASRDARVDFVTFLVTKSEFRSNNPLLSGMKGGTAYRAQVAHFL
jgi:hypothetical protein